MTFLFSRSIRNHTLAASVVGAILWGQGFAQAEEAKPTGTQRPAIAIAAVKRSAPVDFEKDVLPVLKNNCLACHNQTTTKGDLSLETPQTIRKGGESGPAVVPGKSGDSLLLQVAAHQKKPMMPPRENKVAAANLTPEELGLLKLWIDEGATGEVRAGGPIEWQPLPPGLNPIYAVAVTADGQFAACGRANQIFIYHVPSGQLVTRLTDPRLVKTNSQSRAGVAHLDLVHSLAFSPDGTVLASGGYREAKLWRRPRHVQKFNLASAASNAVQVVAASADGKWLATGGADSSIKLWSLADGTVARVLGGHEKAITSLKFSPNGTRLYSASADKSIRAWTVSDGTLFAQTNLAAEVNAVTWVDGDKQIAAGGADNVIGIWQLPDTTNGAMTMLRELKGHEGAVTALATLAPGGTNLLSGSADGSVRLWDISSGKTVRELKHGGPVAAVAVRGDGKRFASAGLNNVAKLWEASEGKQVAELKGDRYANEALATAERAITLAVNEVGYRKTALESAEKAHKTETERLAKATETNSVVEKIFAEKQKNLQAAAEARTGAEKALAEVNAEVAKATDSFNEAEKLAKQIAAAAKAAMERATQTRLLADQAGQTKLEIAKVAAEAAAVAARTKASAALEPAGSQTPEAKVTAEKMAAEAEAVSIKTKAFAESVAADAEMKAKVAADAKASAEKTIDEVAARSYAAGQIKTDYDRITKAAPEKIKGATEKLTAATNALVSAEKEFKKTELTKSNTENELRLATRGAAQAMQAVSAAQAALSGAEEHRKQREGAVATAKAAVAEAEKAIRSVAFSPDHLTVATAGDDRAVHTWSAEDGVAFETLQGHTGPVFTVTFTGADVLASGGAGSNAVVWELNAGWTLARTLGSGDGTSPLADRVNVVRFSPDGQLLATGGGEPTRGGEIKLWQVDDGTLRQDFKNIHSDTVLSLDFSPDGKHLASGAADKFARVLEVASGKVVKAFEGHTHHVLGVSWKRDGRVLATAGADNVVKVWDFVSGERKKNIEGFSKEVTSISFVGITDQAVVSAGDHQVRLVRDNAESVRSFSGGTDYMHSSAVTPDGKIVLAGGEDSVLRVWNGSDGQPMKTFLPPEPQ